MSYTAPQYVDTKEQAVLALASVIADEDKTALGNGSVNKALDVLADVLAQQDVQVPQTNAGAILALAQYVGGGGGAEFGSLISYTVSSNVPEVNDPFSFSPIFSNVYVGETKIISSPGQYKAINQAAAGLIIELLHLTSSTVSGYICTYSVDEYGDPDSYTEVEAWTGTIDVTSDAMGGYSAKFTLPELTGEHKQLLIVAQLRQ